MTLNLTKTSLVTFKKKFSSDLNEIWYVGRGSSVMLDGMSDSIEGSTIENLHSREVDRQSPTGLIFVFAIGKINILLLLLSLAYI